MRPTHDYTGHGEPIATLTDPVAGTETEVLTYPDGPLFTVRDTEGAVRTMTVAVPWSVIEDLARHHAAVEAVRAMRAHGKDHAEGLAAALRGVIAAPVQRKAWEEADRALTSYERGDPPGTARVRGRPVTVPE